MKRNERSANISSFPLRAHGDKSEKTLKTSEITSDIWCSIFKSQGIQDTIGVSKYRKLNSYTSLKLPLKFCL